MERRAERATALGGARVLAISVASIRGKIDHPGAATTGGRPEVAKPFQTDESRKPFFPARFRDLAMRSESDWGRQSVDSSRPWPVHFSASYGLLPCRTSHRLPPEGSYGTQRDCSPRVAQILDLLWPCRRDNESRKNRRGGHSDRVSRRSSAVRRKKKGVTMTVPGNVLLQRYASAFRIPFRYAPRRVPRRVGTFG